MSQPPSNPNVSQEVSPEQKVLQTIYENIEAQQKLLAELVNTPAWSALLDLRAQYTEASDSLNRLVKKSGVGVGPVTLRDSYSKYYDPPEVRGHRPGTPDVPGDAEPGRYLVLRGLRPRQGLSRQ